jgi:hypothetical protein
LAKVYKPIWEYDARTLANDLSAHIVYGTVASPLFSRSLGRSSRRESLPSTSIRAEATDDRNDFAVTALLTAAAASGGQTDG